MLNSKVVRIVVVLAILGAGMWLLFQSSSLTPETAVRQDAVQLALAPGRQESSNASVAESGPAVIKGDPVSPASVNVGSLPSRAAEVDKLKLSFESGQADLSLNEGPISDAAFQAMLKESEQQPVDLSVQNYSPLQQELNQTTADIQPFGVLNPGSSFKSIDYTQSQQGVPPDPDIMVGKDHIVVGVNTSFQVFDKSGTSLVGPTLYEDFWGSNCGTGSGVTMFDPYSQYDEENGRYVMGITAYDPNVNGGDNGYACIAVSKTDSATGDWWLYSFDGNPGTGTDYFFDYPHIGIGQDAIYLGSNMFGNSFVRNHIFAYEKDAMYAGQSADSVKINVGTNNFTIQPAKIKGYLTGGWPTNPNEPHYFIDAQYGNNQNTLTVWEFSDPWGSPSFTQAGTVTVNSYSLPVSQPQLGGSDIQGNDNRLLDVEYWGGKLWTTHAVGCNPGGGTVNCIRWYEIDISSGSPSLVQQGTFSSSSTYRSFPDLAVNACGDMLVGYTMTSNSMYPSVYVAGREAGDTAGQLKGETLVHAGEDYYTAYDSAPRRWGDYTGMAMDPDGRTFWYVGEYSRNQATARWSTWVSAHTWSDCNLGPTPTPGPTYTPTNTPPPTNTPGPVSCTIYDSTDVPLSISSSGTPSVSSNLNIGTSGTIADLNVLNLNGTHTYVSDLDFNLISPSGTEVQIMDVGCSSNDNFNINLDDEAASGSWPCPPTDGGTYQPTNPLSAFDGQNSAGTWTLRVDDNANLDGGSLNGWSLEICTEGTGPTATNTPVPTSTNTPIPTATNTSIPTSTNTPIPTSTNTPIPTATNTPVATSTNTPIPTITNTPQPGGDIFFDDFESGSNWITNPNGSDTARTGQWEVGNPEDTNSSGAKQLGTTVSGSNDLVTGRLAGSSVGTYDIDNGPTSVRSPNISLPTSGDITLEFSYYLAHTSNSSTADYLRVSVVGSSTQLVLEELGAANDDDAAWASFSTSLNSFAGQTVYLLVEAADNAGGSIVEAALDDVRVFADDAAPTPTPAPGSCTVYTSSNVPIPLPNGTASISSNLNVSGSSAIDDLNVTVDMDHVWVGDISFVLTHQDTGTAVTIIDRPGVPSSTYGCSGDDILATLDDEAGTAVEGVCASSAPTISGTYSPNNALSAFDGESGNGTWVLEVIDSYTSADPGTLNGWSVEICTP